MDNKPAPQRDERGRLLPGSTANPGGGGRPKLPDWFKSKAPEALQHLLNVATGVEPAEPELRLKAAMSVVDRFYGKAPETVTVEGQTPLMDILVAMAKPVKSDDG